MLSHEHVQIHKCVWAFVKSGSQPVVLYAPFALFIWDGVSHHPGACGSGRMAGQSAPRVPRFCRPLVGSQTGILEIKVGFPSLLGKCCASWVLAQSPVSSISYRCFWNSRLVWTTCLFNLPVYLRYTLMAIPFTVLWFYNVASDIFTYRSFCKILGFMRHTCRKNCWGKVTDVAQMLFYEVVLISPLVSHMPFIGLLPHPYPIVRCSSSDFCQSYYHSVVSPACLSLSWVGGGLQGRLLSSTQKLY